MLLNDQFMLYLAIQHIKLFLLHNLIFRRRLFFLQGDEEREPSSFPELWRHRYVAFQLLQYKLGNGQTETHAPFVNLLGALHLSEEFEELSLLFLLDTDAWIFHISY